MAQRKRQHVLSSARSRRQSPMIVVNGPEMGLEQPVRAPAAHWAAVRRHEGCARNVVADSTPHRGSPISRIWSKPVEPLPELGSETCSDERPSERSTLQPACALRRPSPRERLLQKARWRDGTTRLHSKIFKPTLRGVGVLFALRGCTLAFYWSDLARLRSRGRRRNKRIDSIDGSQ